jgi:hypothetical protein
MLLSTVCAALAATAAVFACILVAVDKQHMLRGDRLILRHGREAGVAHWIHSQSIKVPPLSGFLPTVHFLRDHQEGATWFAVFETP